MTRLLDTNIAIALLKGNEQVFSRLRRHRPGNVAISSITESELRFGADKSSQPDRNHAALDRVLVSLPAVPFDSDCAREYGRLRAHLEAKGMPIGSMDTLIAAHALALRVTLVTNNTREFRRVPGLTCEDWLAGAGAR